MAKRKSGGRKKGGHNKGIWFREGRGWYASEGKRAVPLRDDTGNHIKSADGRAEAEKAYHRYAVAREERDKQQAKQEATGAEMAVMEVCRLYLDWLQKNKAASTYDMCWRYLFDLCTGFPARFRRGEEKPTPSDRIHKGYGDMAVGELTADHVDAWIEAHPGWSTGRDARKCIKAATSWAAKRTRRLIPSDPLKGMSAGSSGSRVAYITKDQETKMLGAAKPAVRTALHVLIRTGARPIVEFASLEWRHVEETADGMLWRFPAEETKTRKKPREIYVPAEVAKIVREQHKRYPTGKVFRNTRGEPWTHKGLKQAFSRLKKKLEGQGTKLDPQVCLYSTRHTYAQRWLAGDFGPPITLEILAGLMGDDIQTCWKHYAKWKPGHRDPFWRAINGKANPT